MKNEEKLEFITVEKSEQKCETCGETLRYGYKNPSRKFKGWIKKLTKPKEIIFCPNCTSYAIVID